MKTLLTSLLVILLSGCVTTRAELNEKKTHAEVEESQASEPQVITQEPKAAPQSQYGMEEMRAELARLSGRVEEMEQEKKNRAATQVEEQNKLQVKIDELEKQLKEKEEAANPKLPEGKTPFEAGKDAYLANQFETAIYFFDWFISKNEQDKHVEEAVYLRAESNYKLKEYKKAIVDYSKFPEKYSKSAFHSKSLLKIGECFEALGMMDDAKAFYSDLLDKFPKTVEGKIAKKKLARKTNKK